MWFNNRACGSLLFQVKMNHRGLSQLNHHHNKMFPMFQLKSNSHLNNNCDKVKPVNLLYHFKRGLITQHECMPVEGMWTSSYPLTHTGIALYWEKLWNASKDVK